jgi:hypothetical protein
MEDELTYNHAFVSRLPCGTSLMALMILQLRLQYGRQTVESHQDNLKQYNCSKAFLTVETSTWLAQTSDSNEDLPPCSTGR